MEEARHWVWAKRKHGLSTHLPVVPPAKNSPSFEDDSWEEQAFAEDSAGPLGGCIWPPRSYSCSFCRREFRSAQALGGHMNVHRRDRARLKQSPPDQINMNPTVNHHQVIDPLITSLTTPPQYPPAIPHHHQQVCALLYNNPNPNSDHPPQPGFLASPSSFSASATAACTINKQNYCHKQASFPPYYSSSLLQEAENNNNNNNNNSNNKRSSTSTNTTIKFPHSPHHEQYSWSNLASSTTAQYNSNRDRDGQKDGISDQNISSCRAKGDYHVKTDLSVSLNLVVCRANFPSTTESAGKEEAPSCKRRRTTDYYSSSILFSPLKPSSDHHDDHDHDVDSGLHVEDLDLELRLGDRPKVIK